MEKVSINIEKLNGRWLVNGKRITELNAVERKFLEDFFQEVRIKDGQILISKHTLL